MIRKWGKTIKDYFFNPCPTLFDLCVCLGATGIAFIGKGLQGFYLEFYAIFIIVIGFYYKEQRQFKGGSLTILCLVSLITLFVHSFVLPESYKNISFQYLNFYLMHEGFAYVFFSCALFYTVITKAKNLRVLMITLPIIAKMWWNEIIYCGQMTPMLAIGVGFFVYLLIKKEYKWATLVALVALNVVAFNYKWLLMKFECRPHVWKELWEIIKYPINLGGAFTQVHKLEWWHFILGSGYNKLVVSDNLLSIRSWGGNWLFRHNDFLSLMAYIGAFSIIPIVLFIKELARKFKGTWFIAILVAVIVLCSIQTTFIRPDRVVIILLGLSWMWIECDRQKLSQKV